MSESGGEWIADDRERTEREIAELVPYVTGSAIDAVRDALLRIVARCSASRAVASQNSFVRRSLRATISSNSVVSRRSTTDASSGILVDVTPDTAIPCRHPVCDLPSALAEPSLDGTQTTAGRKRAAARDAVYHGAPNPSSGCLGVDKALRVRRSGLAGERGKRSFRGFGSNLLMSRRHVYNRGRSDTRR